MRHYVCCVLQEYSLEDMHKLSDAWEFQETEIMNARNKLRSIRAKIAVLEGKIALEIMYVIPLMWKDNCSVCLHPDIILCIEGTFN